MRSVYMMKTSHDLYKVGVAKNVENRRRELQTSNGSVVLLVTHALTGDALKLEKQIHKMLDNYKQPGGREWFELTPEQAIKVCIYIHQQKEVFHTEDEIRTLLDEYGQAHEKLVANRKELEGITIQIGSHIQKAITRLQRYKPVPKAPEIMKKPKSNEDKVLFERATAIVRAEDKASTSLLQRKLKIGYGRAARLIEDMETKGIVGPPDGSRPRMVYPDKEELTKAVDRFLDNV